MPRAMGIAQKLNLNTIAFPVDYRSTADDLRKFDFNLVEHLNILEPAWKEWIGLTVYYFTGKTSQLLPEQKLFR